jgi:hypothetical protein
MCEFEKNILKLLELEKLQAEPLFKDKNAPYLKSLEHGIQNAKEKLKACQLNRCMDKVYKQNPNVRISDFSRWSKMQIELSECKE